MGITGSGPVVGKNIVYMGSVATFQEQEAQALEGMSGPVWERPASFIMGRHIRGLLELSMEEMMELVLGSCWGEYKEV